MIEYYKNWPPKPDEVRDYYINTRTGRIKITVKGIPPCLWCGEPVMHISMDGPLVCPACDCGNHKDGTKWTDADYKRFAENFRKSIEKYIKEMKTHG